MVPTIQKLEKIADLVKTVLYINIFFLTVFVAPFSNVPNQWKTKLLTSLDHFIYKHNTFSFDMKQSRLAKIYVF